MSVQDSLLVFIEPDGAPGRWRLLSGGAIVGRGDAIEELPEARDWVETILAVPGEDVTIHWLDLAENMSSAQAVAAARLQLADAIIEPIGDIHIVAGRREAEKVAVALVPAALMTGWIDAARAADLDPDAIVPTSLLLAPPAEGFVRFAEDGAVPDYRALASAFSVEDDLAELIVEDAPVTTTGARGREAALGPILADPVLNLRQGAFTRRRPVQVDKGWLRRSIWLAAALVVASVAIEITAILRVNWAVDSVQAEAGELRRRAGTGAAPRAGFAPLAGIVFGAARDTTNATIGQLSYQPDGTMRVSALADNAATIEALRARIEAGGLQAALSLPTTADGRAAAELTVRPR